MSRASMLIVLGILAMLTPFSGLPESFRTFLTVFFGALVLIAGLMMRAAQVKAARAAMEAEKVPATTEVAPPSISAI